MPFFDQALTLVVNRFEDELQKFCSSHYHGDWLPDLACTYALTGGGKRIRPALTILCNEVCCGSMEQAIAPAIAIEMIHTYSLIHDDLPCMDNDAERRGRATLHVKYDEATALLTGDALLTDAFQLIATNVSEGLNPTRSSNRLQIVAELAKAAGSHGMVKGQLLDLYWTARSGASLEDLDKIHAHKTGSLIAAACALGALSANGSADEVTSLRRFGHFLGMAFQVIDDLLDEAQNTGKSRGKDKKLGKLTYLSTMSKSEAVLKAEYFTNAAFEQLERFGDLGAKLRSLGSLLLIRSH